MSKRVALSERATPPALARAEISRQLSLTGRPLLLAAGATLLGLAPVLFLAIGRGMRPELLARDIFALTGTPVYLGLLSNMGLLVWAAAAAVWLLTAGLLARLAPRHELGRLALAAGLYTLLLLADDAMMLHEELLPRKLGLPEAVFTGAYALSAAALLILGARRILSSRYPLCLAAGGFLAASMTVDDIIPIVGAWLLLEDGLKFAGIVTWLVYAVTTAVQALEEARQ